jgi:hypothetical protein
MLLGLAAAVLLAMVLQLGALRARKAAAFECASGGVINLKAWVVLESGEGSPGAAFAAGMLGAAREVLLLPGRVVRAARRRVRRPMARLVRTMVRLVASLGATAAPLAVHAAAATGPPERPPDLSGTRCRSPDPPKTSPSLRRPPGPPGGRFAVWRTAKLVP